MDQTQKDANPEENNRTRNGAKSITAKGKSKSRSGADVNSKISLSYPKFNYKHILMIFILILIVSILLFPHIFPESESKGRIVVMDFQRLSSDWDPGAKKFKSLSAGDVLRLEDVITELKVENEQTHLTFNGGIVIIDADVSEEYNVNDEIVIILTMAEYEDVQYGYKFQWFEEDSDGARGNLVLPPTCLHHPEEFESGIDDVKPE